MKNYIKHDNWNIIEEGFHVENNRISESLFSLGNGRMGQRGNFEEKYSGDSMQGTYIAGVYYPDKTRVGWWKNGYPEYFAKVLNAPSWIGINVEIEGEELDLNTAEVIDFKRVLNMKDGFLYRTFTARLASGKEVKVEATRFCSIVDDEAGVIKYAITPLNFSGNIKFTPTVDADVVNEDSNYDEKFWTEAAKGNETGFAYVTAEVRKTLFQVTTAMDYAITVAGAEQALNPTLAEAEKFVSQTVEVSAKEGEEVVFTKYAAVVSSLNHDKAALVDAAKAELAKIKAKGFDAMLAEQAEAWASKWELSDIKIEGDVAAQQGIRFNIFQLNQTYTGEDARLNIGPKGFTGEKYGGVTYWDTEAYCVPFYLCTADPKVARNLLVYRHNHLERAIENAGKLGFDNGAALYPMVTINGEECHNEWEITFEEIHRNGSMSYAIYNYIRHTQDYAYLAEYGFDVLLGVARFWAQRVHFSEHKNQYVMHGVTGPNEFDNNVDNNWYTNYIASWSMRYAQEAVDYVKANHADRYAELVAKNNFNEAEETAKWKDIVDNMYYPYDEKRDIFLQADNFLDKEQILVKDLDPKHLPLVHNWSWDRILRSNFIKQADVLQGLYFFEHEFDVPTLKRNYDFYEPRTVHESSLSPCVHSIIAARIGDMERAYEFYLRTSRLDLDNYNEDSQDGCHTTSMAGTWMSVIEGFGGKRVIDEQLSLEPQIPSEWEAYTFKIVWRGATMDIRVDHENVTIKNNTDVAAEMLVYGAKQELAGNGELVIPVKK
ncbi:glycoside hydrolase family 65 protein [Sediminitomix flava]|uniref:Maltose phosphorylase n=1 Tax=Sediminitomix flava TaxID=379075 RepID=A0A316A3H4_SEDFL|nr:glycoside hydrolase family 65 protein [Sediminitomix flava]PWJ44277.1 maltose phosphorylase [Sediminitomix flava]